MRSLIQSIHDLPTGVVGHVLTYVPRNDTAQIMHDACKADKLKLRYVRRMEMVSKEYIYDTLAPSVCGSTMYGDEYSGMMIIRTHISMGERVKLRWMGQCESKQMSKQIQV